MERYQAVYIFGSVARNEASVASDLDVQVLVDHKNPCAAVNHPVINGVKSDATFLSFEQLAARTEREVEKGNRVAARVCPTGLSEAIHAFGVSGDSVRHCPRERQSGTLACHRPAECPAGNAHQCERSFGYALSDPEAVANQR